MYTTRERAREREREAGLDRTLASDMQAACSGVMPAASLPLPLDRDSEDRGASLIRNSPPP